MTDIITTKLTSVKITPEMALELLSRKNPGQRRLSERRIKILMHRIMDGKWDPEAGEIKVRHDGVLLNGYHRLTAIARAGIPVKAYILTGKDSRYMDDVVTRSVADRNMISKDEAGVCNFAGQLIGIQDNDISVDVFYDLVIEHGVHKASYNSPWRCQAVWVGALAACINGHDGIGTIKRLSSATPATNLERRICVLAQQRKIESYGNGRRDTTALIFGAACGKSAEVEDVRKVLRSCYDAYIIEKSKS